MPTIVLINIKGVQYTDVDKSKEYFTRALQKIEKEKIFGINSDIILEYLRHKQAEGVGYKRLLRVFFTLKSVLKDFVNKDIRSITQKEVEEIVAKIMMSEAKEWTKITHIKILKNFLRWLKKNYNVKIDIDSIKAKKPKNSILPEYLLTPEEFNRIFNATDDIQMRTFLGILYESGARIGEILSLKIKNVRFDSYGAEITVKGKTGQRVIPIIWYAGLLRQYLEIHPLKDDPEAPLFYYIDGKGILKPLTYATIRKRLKNLCKKAGIKKRITFHLFRHTRLTELAKKLPEQVLKRIAGWVPDSDMAKTYIHLSQKDIKNELLSSAYGIKVGEKEEDGKKICPRCGEINPSNAKLCWRCRTPLDEKEVIERTISEDEINKWAEILLEFFKRLERKNPEIWKELAEIIKVKGISF